MSIQIKKQETFIPLEVGDIKLKFHYTDDSMLEVRKQLLKTQKEIGRIEGEEWDNKEMEQAKEILTKAMDSMFGKDTFKQIYAMTPSVIVVLDYFKQMVDGVTNEMSKRGIAVNEDKLTEKYLPKE